MTPYRIVVGVDFSGLALGALEQALAQAAAHPDAELHVASVIDGDHAELVPEEHRHASLTELADETHDRLQRCAWDAQTAHLSAHGGPETPVFTHVRVGAIADQLVSLAAEIGAELVVVGTHGRRGLQRLMMGSVAEKLVRLAPCPVLVVRPRDLHAMDGVPLVEPPCPDCVATRERTAGESWWCEAHTREPDGVHIYSRSERLDQPSSSHVLFGSS